MGLSVADRASRSVEGKMRMALGAEPEPMNATAKTEVLLGDRCIIEEFKTKRY